MAWLAEYPDAKAVREQAEKAMLVPLGLASPFWLAFGAAATAGMGWWWLARLSKAANVETAPAKSIATPPAPTAKKAIPAPEPVIEAPVVVAEIVEETVQAAASYYDDLTRLVGIGPKLADALAARGVTTFAQVAAWTDADVERFDHDLNLRGRAARNQWVAQAKSLLA